MLNNTMTLVLNGDIPFKAFAAAVASFSRLVDALSTELDAADGVEWFIDDLEKSSTIATIRGESETPDKVERVVSGFIQVGKAVETRTSVPFSNVVVRHGKAITEVLDHHVTSVRFETAEEEITISTRPSRPESIRPAYGTVEGRVQTLTNRNTLRFTLYDTLYDRAVSCYLVEGQEGAMREAWGKRAIVEGLITRDSHTGRPTTIRGVSKVRLLSDAPGNYLTARGIAPVPDATPLPEDIIRRLHDG